ncbi:SusC/RagA family TonB-linked outer membrane protein [Niastella koreensis]|uniref:TonB-dependent receptor plug n=2 Tax=Niastella koreensis TaxID=354356 RepID=G8TM75_NIAKG|nr:TonB-dependent receptor [Niastella koreensis]AEV99848.1 TonB-dependent receptor plug [Niastella koreensis GR20-10]OQP51535.1 SusC/RagA family TonB-linked outer membrane protein [Niastella koreensis]
MKFSTVFLLAACLQVHAIGFSQKLSLTRRDAPLEQVFKEIRKQTGYLFFYDLEWLQKAKPVNIDVKNVPLKVVLDQCLAGQPLTYNIVDKTIVLSLKEEPKRPIVQAAVMDELHGHVYGQNREPIEGVTITVRGQSRGGRTNAKGEFTLRNIEAGMVLEFSYVGYVTYEVKVVDAGKELNVTLQIDSKGLENVVVIGYGTVKKKDLTGSVSQVSMEDINKAPVGSFDQALAGRVAGVMVSSTEGQPGAGINIVIRGNNSITQSNSPLYVIDGFPIENPDNNMLNPNDIESMDVLKDASATAIYGARGANGVIIITTKKGKDGPPVVRYSGYYGLQNNLKTIPVMNPYEFVKLQQDIGTSDLKDTYLANGVTLDDYKNVQAVDWQNKLYRQASMMDHSLSVTGGSARTRYSASGDLFNQDGIIVNSNFKRYQGKISIDQTFDKAKVGGYIMYTNTKRLGTIPSSLSGSSMNNLLYGTWGYRPASPINPTKAISTDFQDELLDDMVNPTTDYRMNPVIIAQNEYRLKNNNNLIANAYVEYSILKNLKLRVTGGINKNSQRYDVFNNSKTRSGNPSSVYGVNGSITYTDNTSWLNENTLTFDKRINNDHKINVVAGVTAQATRYEYNGTSANLLPYESLGLSGLGYGALQPVYPDLKESSLLSGLSRVNYTFKDRYLFTASFRADGSSKFRPGRQWGYFPSGAFAWRLSSEPFMKEVSFLSDAKIRASWGKTGNNRVDEYATYSEVDFPISAYYSYNNALQQGAILASMANEDLKWETTGQTDVGFDVSFLHQRLSLTVDYYKKVTSDLLLLAALPPTSGYGSAYKNIGKTSNEGLEIALSSNNITNKNFSWTTSFNIAFNKSKVMQLTQNQESMTSVISWDSWYASVPLYLAKLGQPLGQIYGYISDGVYQYDDFDKLANGNYILKDNIATNGNTRSAIQPGDAKYRDLNNDKVINDYDRTVIGRGLPRHIGGISNNFHYRGFDLNIFFQWSYGNDIVNANRLNFENGNKTYLNQFQSFQARWTPDHTNTTMPRAGGQYGYVYSTRIIEDGSYLRFKTAALGYTLSSKLLGRAKIKSCRIYVAAQNLLTWTKYTGSDPEVSIGYSALTPGFDYSSYPRARTVTLGLNLSL